MKEQLEALAQEMIQEIKDLKDLTKKELPEVAKEYVNYNIVTSLVAGAVGALIFIVGLILAFLAFKSAAETDSRFLCGGAALFCFIIGSVFLSVNVCHYLEFKLQPRRKAIEAVTKLFK